MHPSKPKRQPLTPEVRAELAADTARLEACFEHARAHACGDVEGLFGPGSMMWRVFRESISFSAGIEALLLQIALPAVGAGVAQNSNFRSDVIGRARRTFASLAAWVFGDLPTALTMSFKIHKLHARVRGTIPADISPRLAGTPYRANDPPLLFWVHATIIDGSARAYERFVEPLSRVELERYHREANLLAIVMGVPPDQVPPTWADFQAYMQCMLHGDALDVGPTTREIAHTLFNNSLTRGPLDEALTIGLLPEHLRAAFDLPWGPTWQRASDALFASLRVGRQVLPDLLRYLPGYHQARLRVALAEGKPLPWDSRLINRIDHVVDLPLSLKPLPIPDIVEESTSAADVRERISSSNA
ncbi:oxygenase MpaB family protein [Chondromyces crocatus]|uniref:ER-bound oxygenase mpaB/mpaB'/Rubber oxygenase catalytic domain-containing protein n=1 Tax=Chondromyces crocatus TaxID=52 RepID=A0A0K1EAC3_CHOCO|nr:oxygenase MpaB family protein [Chondromyces crocatus]AKT37831.1 uncharacterized protein CMC5_019740 [Chondromyces crocatus]